MKRVLFLSIMGLIVAGCGDSGPGDLPPPTKPLTQAEIDAMPPEARASMQNAQKQGQAMEANRGVNGPK